MMGEHSHSHTQDHSHSHSHATTAPRRVLLGVLVLSLGYMGAEIAGGLISGSLALLADAGHMALDSAAIAIGLFASWVSARPPSERKTFGYYRAEILAAALNATTLVIVSLWIFYEAWERFQEPPVVQGGLMTAVAAGGLAVNGVSLYLLSKFSRGGLNMRGVWMHVLTDALGSISAMVAGFLVWQFGWTAADPVISVVIAVLILYGGWKLLVNCVDVLLVAAPDELDPSAVRRDIECLPGVTGVHDLHVWAVSTGVNSLTAHVSIAASADPSRVLEEAVDLLSAKYELNHATLQIEPSTFSHRKVRFCAPGQGFQAEHADH